MDSCGITVPDNSLYICLKLQNLKDSTEQHQRNDAD